MSVRRGLREDLAIELIKMGPLVGTIDAAKDTWMLNRVEVATRLLLDSSFTESVLMDGVFLVIRGMIMANGLIVRSVRLASPKEPDSNEQ